jgi:hypothetical protein
MSFAVPDTGASLLERNLHVAPALGIDEAEDLCKTVAVEAVDGAIILLHFVCELLGIFRFSRMRRRMQTRTGGQVVWAPSVLRKL